MNKVTIALYASFREAAGARQIEIELDEAAQVSDLRQILAKKYPQLAAALNNALIAVNKEYAFDDELIPLEAELAVFPPVSGGEACAFPTIFEITSEELDLERLLARISLESSGAACIFTGMVRGVTRRTDPHETEYLEYEAYKPMAEKKMAQIAAEIRQRWPDVQGIALVQRIGRLYPRTPAVIIACTAAHRDTGVFEAARYGIDRLKEIVPVWKKEIGSKGEQWVEGDYLPGPDD
jgi:MoaE-MoaD fusion protein